MEESIVARANREAMQEFKTDKQETAKQQYQDYCDLAIQKYVESEREYGADNFVTMINATCCELTNSMRDAFMAVSTIEGAMGTLTSVLGLMDDSMQGMQEFMKEANKSDYSVRGRWQRRKLFKKYKRNISGRFKEISVTIKNFQGISQDIVKLVGKFSKNLGTSFSVKTKNKKGANSGQAPHIFNDPKLAAAIEAKRNELGAKTPSGANAPTQAGGDLSDSI